jgi:hypothetical protein
MSRALILGERGYLLAGEEDVVVSRSRGAPSEATPRAEAMPWQAWIEIMQRTSELPDEAPTKELVSAAAQLSTARLFRGARGRSLDRLCAARHL